MASADGGRNVAGDVHVSPAGRTMAEFFVAPFLFDFCDLFIVEFPTSGHQAPGERRAPGPYPQLPAPSTATFFPESQAVHVSCP